MPSISFVAVLTVVVITVSAGDVKNNGGTSVHYEGSKPVKDKQPEAPQFRFKPTPYAISLDFSDLFTGTLNRKKSFSSFPFLS